MGLLVVIGFVVYHSVFLVGKYTLSMRRDKLICYIVYINMWQMKGDERLEQHLNHLLNVLVLFLQSPYRKRRKR